MLKMHIWDIFVQLNVFERDASAFPLQIFEGLSKIFTLTISVFQIYCQHTRIVSPTPFFYTIGPQT